MRKIPILVPVLALITILFLSILVFAYVETKKANPQMIETSRASSTIPGPRPPAPGPL